MKNKDELNYEEFLKVYDGLKNLLKKSSDEDIELYINNSFSKSNFQSESELRSYLYKLRDEK